MQKNGELFPFLFLKKRNHNKWVYFNFRDENPRIPFVDDYEKFKKLSELGKELVELHLMKKRLPIKVKFDILVQTLLKK